MNSSVINHIIFDFGGVILKLKNELNKNIISIPNDLAQIFNISIKKSQRLWNIHKNSLIIGKENPQEFLIKIQEYLNTKIDINKSYELWKEKYKLKEKNINWELLNLISQLKESYYIHMLTDTIDLPKGNKDLIYKIDNHFHHIFRSYEQKLKKPDSQTFLNVLQKIKAKPEECIFIDDIKINITEAEKLGINCHLFTTNNNLLQYFKSNNINI